MPLLKDLHIRITSRCNFNCLHCYATDWFKDDHYLDLEILKSVILQAKELGCKKVTFTGGEPLISQNTIPIIKFCLDNNLKVEIETNGFLVNKIIPKLIGYLKKIEFAISYDGQRMRGPKNGDRVLTNIKILKNIGCDVKIQTVLTKINVDESDIIFEFSRQNNINHRVFLSHSLNGNGKNIPPFEIDEWLKILKNIKEKHPHVVIELPDLFSGGSQKKCGWGVHRCELMSNGDVTSCAPITFNKRDFIAGNIKHQRLEEIWNSKHFEYIRSLTQSDFQGLCKTCNCWKTCLGACRSISYSIGNDLLSPHPFCVALFNKIQTENLALSLVEQIPNLDLWLKNVTGKICITENEKYLPIVESQHK